jgi:hypothetical protein
VGCAETGGGDHPDTAPVTGTVTYNGSPVEGATLTFSPASGGYAALGLTDASGNFTLKTPWGSEGAVPGSYKVAISKTAVEGAAAGEAEEVEMVIEEPEKATPAKIAEGLPEKYKSAATSELTAEVKAEGPNTFAFELTD